MKRILIVDDDPSFARTLQLYFRKKRCNVSISGTGKEALKLWLSEDPDLILLDVQLPDMDGSDVLANARKRQLGGEVVMITGFHNTETTLKAIRLGAIDYLCKPIDRQSLDLLLEKMAVQKIQRERAAKLCHIISDSYGPEQLIGRSSGMLNVIKAIAQVSRGLTNVLIEGETGTGKELVAKTIHQESAPDEPFIAINCAAVVGNLLESELFGHEKGAFTGAVQSKIGKLECAGGGTVFLDEIGELPLEFQAKLLRVLQEREFQKVGGNKTLSLQARIVAATNRDLHGMVKEGLFREDLYFRLKGFVIRIPPLRERTEDILPLIEYFLTQLNQEMNKKIVCIPKTYLEELRAYEWPGNIRELHNVLRRGVILSRGDILELDESWVSGMKVLLDAGRNGEVFQTLQELEKTHIFKVLEYTGWNYGEACGILGVSRPTLRKKIVDYGLAAEAEDSCAV